MPVARLRFAAALVLPVPLLLSATGPASATSAVPLRPDRCERTAPITCLGPFEQRAAYGVDRLIASGTDGSGVTVVVIDAFADPYLEADLAACDAHFGLPTPEVHVDSPYGVPKFHSKSPNAGFAGATTLDVEQVHAMAPGARIDVVLAKSADSRDIIRATRWAVDHRVGDVVVSDLGEGESCEPKLTMIQHHVFGRGTAKGMTFVSGTGVSGPVYDCGKGWKRQADVPPADPNVLAVGSTRLSYDGKTLQRLGERVFNERKTPAKFGLGWQATGSGYSSLFAEPDYQRSVQQSGHRATPDVAISGSDTIGTAYVARPFTAKGKVEHLGGGIFAGSQWAGILALAVQQAGHGLGNVNAAIYDLATDPGTSARLFHDITKGNNTIKPPGSSRTYTGYSATTGWDPVSGFGTPKADALVPALAAWKG